MINNFLYKYSFKIGHLMVTKSFKSFQLMIFPENETPKHKGKECDGRNDISSNLVVPYRMYYSL